MKIQPSSITFAPPCATSINPPGLARYSEGQAYLFAPRFLNTTEEILVDELAQHFWRMRRFRELEARAWTPENLDSWLENGLLALINRSLASAERSFHKSLVALQKLQRTRGFVPQKTVEERTTPEETGFVPAESPDDGPEKPAAAGFVPQKTAAELAAFEYMGCFPEDMDEYVESIVSSRMNLRHSTEKTA